ncbi:phosphatase PAP2 family protein [Saccharopolyspora taberi]|uniref:phosphatase PAP2 family protein n=1 Tax=Saccharopolyspora taberi TaxID=60895 RepID=UPI0031D7A758
MFIEYSAVNEIEDVPDVSADWYRAITDLAASAPPWVQAAAPLATQAILLVFGALLAAACWRARRGALGPALLAPVATGLAYVASEVLKAFLREDRPCRVVPRISRTLAECPEYGDWSLPSNHATIAAAAAVALSVAWRRLVGVVVLLALVEGFSRVFVGVHYPHDVVVGALLGGFVAGVVMGVGGGLVPVVRWARGFWGPRRPQTPGRSPG